MTYCVHGFKISYSFIVDAQINNTCLAILGQRVIFVFVSYRMRLKCLKNT